jgi:PAS domain S-box
MKVNMPVTNQEIPMKKGGLLVTRTDLKGVITYVNDEFVNISGYSRDELLGAEHNIVRHPDMPPAAFEDLWMTLKSLRPWNGVVKNRTKSGDHYWVEANAMPVFKNGKVHEYLSVRRAPSREKIEKQSSYTSSLMPRRPQSDLPVWRQWLNQSRKWMSGKKWQWRWPCCWHPFST